MSLFNCVDEENLRSSFPSMKCHLMWVTTMILKILRSSVMDNKILRHILVVYELWMKTSQWMSDITAFLLACNYNHETCVIALATRTHTSKLLPHERVYYHLPVHHITCSKNQTPPQTPWPLPHTHQVCCPAALASCFAAVWGCTGRPTYSLAWNSRPGTSSTAAAYTPGSLRCPALGTWTRSSRGTNLPPEKVCSTVSKVLKRRTVVYKILKYTWI